MAFLIFEHLKHNTKAWRRPQFSSIFIAAINAACVISSQPVSRCKKLLRSYSRLSHDGTACALGYVTRMVRDRQIAVCNGIVPDFVGAGRLPIERETQLAEFARDFAVAEPGQPARYDPSISG